MKKTFRQHHLLQALKAYDEAPRPLDVHLSHYFKHNRALGAKDRKFVAETAYSLVRWMGLIDYHCSGDHSWDARLTTYNRLNIEKSLQKTSIPPHIRASFPKTLFELLCSRYGEQAALDLCLASNSAAPTTIRVNPLKTSRQRLLAKWANAWEVTPTRVSVFGIHFPKRLNFQLLEEFKQGLFEIQDEASQLVASLVDPRPGDRILDFCAGSGGKSLAFAHKLQGKGQIYLHDIRTSILQTAKRRLRRAGIENAQILHHDSPNKERLKGAMDWILVDVPCSGSGTLRRNPDLKWKFSQEMLSELITKQRDIFEEALSYLKPDGQIVYATCSLLAEENEEQALFFQERFNLKLTTKPFRSLPTEGGMDGFYAAIFSGKNGGSSL